MKRNTSLIYLPVVLSFFAAFCLMVMPIPQFLKYFRPEFVTLCVIYWVINLPKHVGITFAAIVGLFFDVLTGALLGSMALILAIIAFLTNNLGVRLQIYRFWQKFAVIMLLVAFGQLIRLWVQMLVGHPPASFLYWLSSLTSAFIWPVLYVVLNTYQRSLKVV